MKKARLSYSDNFDVQFLDSSVKKLFIIGIVEATQENFENVSILRLLLKLNKIECTVATDLKMANILIGIMSHSSKYPCKWCTTFSDELHKCGEMRTIRKCIKQFNDWQNNGGKKDKAQFFESCVNKPLFDCDEDTEIIDLIPPPELHLLIGIVNRLYENMLVQFKEEGEEWVKHCYVSREVYFGSSSFNGNS